MSGKKFDTGKAPVFQGFMQYFPRAIRAVANVSAFGAKKYSVAYDDQNWRKVDNAVNRYRDARERHMLDEQIDGLYAPDSNLLHAAHNAWNAMAYLELLLTAGTSETKPEESKEII